ncbi:unnamed protein product, partial [Mesorhabditis belari]|uniref:Cation-transporting ATPase n=1 Tax=Mesorhabditis belari TaxID=2138241 RepID=A0AAF3F2W5_9BILA
MEKGKGKDTDRSKGIPGHHARVQSGDIYLDIFGYRTTPMKTIIFYALTFCTLGIFRLLMHWKEEWYIEMRAEKCSLDEANVVFVIDENQTMVYRSVQIIDQKSPNQPLLLPNRDGTYNDVGRIRYFTFRKMLYAWFVDEEKFIPPSSLDSTAPVTVFINRMEDSNGLNTQEVEQRRITYGRNVIEVKLKPILVLLFKEAITPFYIFQVLSVSLWYWDEYLYYASVIVIISVGSLTLDVYQTRAQEKKLRSMVHSSGEVSVLRDGGTISILDSGELVPGDIIIIPKTGGVMQCDAILMTGTVIVNESMLTGESVPVTKVAMTGIDEDNAAGNVRFDFEKHSKHVLSCGTMVLQTRYYGGQHVRAMVIRTAFSTTKGQLVRSIMYPKPVDIEFNRDLLRFVGFLCCIASIGFAYTIGMMVHYNAQFKKIFIRSLDLVTCVVPPALPAAMSVGIINANGRLRKKDIYCISPSVINTCGMINACCFDKTGTLTEDGLDFQTLRPVHPSSSNRKMPEFGEETAAMVPGEMPKNGEIIKAIAACHSLTRIDGVLQGDPLDLIVFNQTQWTLDEGQESQAEETTQFDKVQPTVVRPPVEHREFYGADEFGVIRQFTFSSALQRMSVIVGSPNAVSDHQMIIYCKGSPEMIVSLCNKETVPADYLDIVNKYAQHGYRLISVACRTLEMSFLEAQKVPRQEVESDLELLGLVVMENRVKSVTKGVIRQLNSARIRTVMVTGDNLLTAMSVARECGIVRADRKAYLLEHVPDQKNAQGRTLLTVKENLSADPDDYMNLLDGDENEVEKMLTSSYQFSVAGGTFAVITREYPELLDDLMTVCDVFARMAPEQKQYLVNYLQTLEYTVSMCGDGANDCAALKAAHAGISLSDAEASIAAPFTSKVADIRCVPTVIREGRAALVTSFGVFKYMANYSIAQFTSVMMLYYRLTNLTDFQFLYIDLFLATFIALFFGNTGACDYLSKIPPPTKLLSIASVVSVVGQMIIFAAAQLFMFLWVTEQPWYFMNILQEDYTDSDLRSHQGTAIWCLSLFQYIVLAFLYSKAAPYRQTILSNKMLCFALVLTTVVSLYVTLWPAGWVISFLEYDPIPYFEDRLFVVVVSCLCCGVSYLFNMFVVEYLILHKLENWRKLRKLADPKAVIPKWERIMLRIGKDTSWIGQYAQVEHALPEKTHKNGFAKNGFNSKKELLNTIDELSSKL